MRAVKTFRMLGERLWGLGIKELRGEDGGVVEEGDGLFGFGNAGAWAWG